jgi:DNA-binding response OmpR family regulator
MGKRTPTIILTARGGVEDRVHGLESGADDYLPKPFAFAELLARIRALLRRAASSSESVVRVGDTVLDCIHRRVARHGKQIELTSREFELLEYLMQRSGQVVTREMIVREVWKEPLGGLTNVIDVYVNYLRKKLEPAGKPQLIHTIRGVGYRFEGNE